MGFFKHSSVFPKKVLSFLLALMMIVPLVLVKTSASEYDIGESIGQSSVVADESQEQTPAGESGINENGEQSSNAEEETDPDAGTYANSVGGMLWLDMYEDIDNGIYSGDGMRQAHEAPLAGYTVSLFKADDRSAAVQEIATGEDGRYAFTGIDPGTYVVSVAPVTIDGIEHLLPFYYLDGSSGDNRFAAIYDADMDAYLYACTDPIEVGGDTAVTDMDAGIRTLPEIAPLINTGEIIVYNEAQFRAALASAAYTTIYLGADITMLSASNNAIVVARTGPLVINGTNPSEGGTRHTYTDWSSIYYYDPLGGACTDITFKDITINIRNYYGIYYSSTTATTVTLDNVTGAARQVFFGRGANSTLVIKDSNLTLSNTGQGAAQEFAENAGTVRFEGKVTVTRDSTSSTVNEFFNLTGSSSTVKIEDGADVLLDNSANTSDGDIFINVTNFTVGEGAKFTCYSASGFCDIGGPLTTVTIRQAADVRFVCAKSHSLSSLYGTANSTFTMEPGSSFLLYDNETDATYSVCYFKNIILDSPKSFIVLNPSARAMGSTYCPALAATGVSSIRYYLSAQIPSVLNTSTYTYTPARNAASWWAQSSPFDITATTWPNPSQAVSNYSSGNVPASTATILTSLTTSNFPAASTVYGIEIYGTLCTVTYDGNGADSGTAPASDAGVPNDQIPLAGNTGGLIRANYTFAGWNTKADGTGAFYSAGEIFALTENTTLYAQWTQNKYTVSGTLSGGSVGGLTVSYTVDGGSVQTVTTDSNGYYAISEVPRGSTVVITPPVQTGYAVLPSFITVGNIDADSTTNNFEYTRSFYTVIEKYVDESTGMTIQSDTSATLTAPSYSYGELPDNITANNEIYIYQGYKIGSYSPGNTPDGTGAPSISVLTADETVYFIYYKVKGTISVTFSTGWDFYVNQYTYPNVETGTMGSSGMYYSFKNESDKPIYVDLTQVQETSSSDLNLVADASLSAQGSGDYSLRLIPAPVELTGAANGFANTVAGILPGNADRWLGALDGRYVRQETPTSTSGYVSIGGYYAGDLSAEKKNPQLTLTFTFSLIS